VTELEEGETLEIVGGKIEVADASNEDRLVDIIMDSLAIVKDQVLVVENRVYLG